MKTTSFRFILAALVATAALVGCTKEITPNFENDKVNSEGSRVIAVSFGQQTKTTLDGFQPRFVDKDSILISNGEALDTCEVKVDDKGATITTKLTGSLTAVYPYTAAGMSEDNENEIDTVLVSTVQSGKFADANICMARMNGENDESLSFENKTAVFKITPGAGESTQYVEVSADGFNIANSVLTGSEFKDYGKIHVATTTADSVWISILVPEGLKVSDLSFSDGSNVKNVTGNTTPIAAGTLYTVTNANWESTEADIPDGALKGVFSVSADKQVHFSQGDLVATINESGTPTDWKFATNQYDYLGEDGANKTIGNTTTSGTAGDVDLFGWSTASTTYGINTSTDNSNYSGNFVDWGKAYCESKSITPDNIWRTLSKDEWQYLFNSRSTTTNTGTTNARYAKATVNGKAGIILLPDTYTHPSVVTALTNINTNNAAFTVNTYDVTAWEAMESAGAVFLPAAGYRLGSIVYTVGAYGHFWSSTAYDENFAYIVRFNSDTVHPDGYVNLFLGFSVRLVTNVSAAPTPTEPTSEYVEIAADYDNNPNTANTTLKWYRQNLAITTSGNKSWKGGNESAVKVPGTNEDVIVGDYFQWAAYAGYCGDATATDKGLLIYDSFLNTKCVDGGSEDSFALKSAGGSDKYQFITSNSPGYVGISPYYSGSAYTQYTSAPVNLDSSDDVANIILGDNWRMPTSAEFQAMREATYWAWDGADKGYYVYVPNPSDDAGKVNNGTGSYIKSDALLFFPAAGIGDKITLYDAGSVGHYWTYSLHHDRQCVLLEFQWQRYHAV